MSKNSNDNVQHIQLPGNMYNMMHAVNPVAFFILPMLGKHADEYPRFRDCFLKDEEHPKYDDHIHVYTRTGGGNRENYRKENQAMREMDGFVTDYDDSFDSTYASWVFKIPERWVPDYKRFTSFPVGRFSKEYRDELDRVYPKLKDKFAELFDKEVRDE